MDVYVLMIYIFGFFQLFQIVLQEVLKDFEKIVGLFKVQIYYYCDISVEVGICYFVDDEKVDFIVIFNYVCYFFKWLFRGSMVEMVVNYVNVLVLSIDYLMGVQLVSIFSIFFIICLFIFR